VTSLRNVLSCQEAAKNPPVKCLRARQAFANSGCFSTSETREGRVPRSSGNPALAHTDAGGRSRWHRVGRASPSLLGEGCQPLLTPSHGSCLLFRVFSCSLGSSLCFGKKQPLSYPCLCAGARSVALRGRWEDLASFPFCTERGPARGDARRAALARRRCLRLRSEAWPCKSCNLGSDRAWVAAAQPVLPFIAEPDAISLFLLERSGSLCPTAGRERANALGLGIVSSLLLPVQLSWSYNYTVRTQASGQAMMHYF